MKAEYQELNSVWFKDCTKCGHHYGAEYLEGFSNFFRRDSKTEDGFSCHCKQCAKKRDGGISQKRRDARRYQKDKWKMKAREQARDYYKNHDLVCAALGCYANAEELHHVDYEAPLIVVPLCKEHHRGIHN